MTKRKLNDYIKKDIIDCNWYIYISNILYFDVPIFIPIIPNTTTLLYSCNKY